MIQITTEDGKYFFSEFVNLTEEQTEEVDENTLTLVDLQYILLAYKTKRITLSEGDLLKVNNKIKELSSTGGGVMPDLSDYVTKQELIEEVFKIKGNLGEEITMEQLLHSLTEVARLYSEIETKIEEVPENLSTTVTELQTFKSTVETDYTKKTDLDSYATLDHFDTLVNNLILLATDKANEAVAKVVDGAPATFDTLKEIATWIENNGVDASDLAASISGKADKTELANYTTTSQMQSAVTSYVDSTLQDVLGDKLDVEVFNTFTENTIKTIVTTVSSNTGSIESLAYIQQGLSNTITEQGEAIGTKLDTSTHESFVEDINRFVESVNTDFAIKADKTELEGISTQLGNKVDKVEGKGLSTEDFTTAYKTKLDTVLPISAGGTGATTLTDLKAALGIPQFIQITQEDYDSLSDIEKNDPLKLYLIIG